MSVEIGNTPESWGVLPSEPGHIPWNKFLDEVAEAGYSWIELGPYGYLPTNPNSLRDELDKRGLKMAAATFLTPPLEDPNSWPELKQLILKMGELLAPIGAGYLNIVDAIHPPGSSAHQDLDGQNNSKRKRLVENTHKAADLASDLFGLQLTLHPHGDTNIGNEEQIETFLDQTDPARVSLCLDTGHHAYCNGDPIDFMRRHHKRIPFLHLKSVDGNVIKRVYSENLTIGTAVQNGVFCEPAKGSLDFKGFANVLKDVGFSGIAIVEQDLVRPPSNVPLPLAKRTLAYFKAAGIA